MKITIEQLNEAQFPSWVPAGPLMEVPESVVEEFRRAANLDKESPFKCMAATLLPAERVRKTLGSVENEVTEFRSTRFRTKDGEVHLLWFTVRPLEWEEKARDYQGFPQQRTTTQQAVFWFTS